MSDLCVYACVCVCGCVPHDLAESGLSKCEFLVGRIVKCWKHESADKCVDGDRVRVLNSIYRSAFARLLPSTLGASRRDRLCMVCRAGCCARRSMSVVPSRG